MGRLRGGGLRLVDEEGVWVGCGLTWLSRNQWGLYHRGGCGCSCWEDGNPGLVSSACMTEWVHEGLGRSSVGRGRWDERDRTSRSCSVCGSIGRCLGSGWCVREGSALRGVVTGCCKSEFLAFAGGKECQEDYTWMVDDMICRNVWV